MSTPKRVDRDRDMWGRDVCSGTRMGNRAGEVSKVNSGTRLSSVSDGALIGRKGEERGLSFEVTGTGAQDDGGGGRVTTVGLCPGLDF